VAEFRKGLAESKRAAQKMGKERFNLKTLNEGVIKEQRQVSIRKTLANLET
jgi:hypothetical protein